MVDNKFKRVKDSEAISAMATAGIIKRSSRLASHDPQPVKVTTERKLRSGKAINKSVEKVNIARNKRLRVSSAKDASHNNSQPLSKRLRPRKSKRNYCEDSKLLQLHISAKQQKSMVILEKLNLTDSKKVPIYKTIKSSEKLSEEKNDVYDFTFDSDDTQRKVTKKKQGKNVNKAKGKVKKAVLKKVVRPRAINSKAIKSLDINLPVKITQRDSSEPVTESVVTRSTRKNSVKKPKIHKIDTNMQKLEEPVKKNSSKVVVTKSTRKNIVEKSKMPEISINIQKFEASVEEDISAAETLKINTDTPTEKSIKEDTLKMMETSGLNIVSQITEDWANDEDIMEVETFKKDSNIQTIDDTTLASRTFCANQDAKKPKIISIENADNIVITKSPPKNTVDLRPFRSKNISNNKTPMKESTNTLNCSLMTKSLSPIVKTMNTMNAESPWCPRTSLMFSGTRHFVQSTPNTNFKMQQKMERNKGNTEMDKENMEMDKENININKENKLVKHIKRNKKEINIQKKPILSKKLPINQISKNVQPTCVSEPVVKPAPARMLLGEIKNLLQTNEKDINMDEQQIKPDINKDSKQADTHIMEADILKMENNKNLVNLVNFSDTFDISEIKNQSNEVTVPLFADLEPSHFVEPPQHSYKRKRGVRFNFSHDSCEEEEEEAGEEIVGKKRHAKKKKLTKSEKEHMKRVDNWVKSINSTFEEIDKYDLLIE